MAEPRSAYNLQDAAEGEDLFLVAPGPSLGEFPIDALRDEKTLAVNSAIEILQPTWWMYADKKITRRYNKDLRENRDLHTIMPSHQAKKVRHYYVGERLYEYSYQMRLTRYHPEVVPFWLSSVKKYLPGRCSVVNCAMSMAWLMKPSRLILVGVDFDFADDYYVAGVEKNGGPQNGGRRRALNSGFGWFRMALMKDLWPDMEILTTSKSLSDRLNGDFIPLIAPGDIIG